MPKLGKIIPKFGQKIFRISIKKYSKKNLAKDKLIMDRVIATKV